MSIGWSTGDIDEPRGGRPLTIAAGNVAARHHFIVNYRVTLGNAETRRVYSKLRTAKFAAIDDDLLRATFQNLREPLTPVPLDNC